MTAAAFGAGRTAMRFGSQKIEVSAYESPAG
jgi:hypothetical protein